MYAVQMAGVFFLLAAVPLLSQYQNGMALPVLGLICLLVGAVLTRRGRINRRK